MKRTIIRISMAIAMSLSLSTAYSSDIEQTEYTPTVGRNFFKTALVGLGIMSMAQADTTTLPITGFYIGKLDEENINPSANLTISKIINTSCNFDYNHYSKNLIDVSLQFSGDFTSYSFPVKDKENILDISVKRAYLCSIPFWGTFPIRIKLNYDVYHEFTYFSMMTYASSAINHGSSLTNEMPCPPPSHYGCQPIRTYFDDVFKHVIDTGTCPPLPTLWPTTLTLTTLIAHPTPRPTPQLLLTENS
jgi:hypothetical protein